MYKKIFLHYQAARPFAIKTRSVFPKRAETFLEQLFGCKKSQNSETLKKTIAAHNPPHQHDRHLHRLQVQLEDKEEQGGVSGAAGVAGCNSASLSTLEARQLVTKSPNAGPAASLAAFKCICQP